MLGRGIGFLADMRRMNVGITRSKCSLFVLGHAQSLHRSDYWGDLVSDAQKRKLIVDVIHIQIIGAILLIFLKLVRISLLQA